MIKNTEYMIYQLSEDQIEKYKKAGFIANTVLHKASKLIKPGVKYLEIAKFVDEEIKKHDAIPAFPVTIGRNEIAAHDIPMHEDQREFTDEDVIKLDVGVAVDGYVGDNAMTVDLTKNYTELVQATRDAVHAAIKIIGPGTLISDIGKEIQDAIKSHGYNPITNLSGHGLAQFKVHTYPTIPNYQTGSNAKLEENMAIAIEPFATDGNGSIREIQPSGIFSLLKTKSTRSAFVKEVQTSMTKFNGLPFSRRWLDEKHGLGKVNLAIREFQLAKTIISHGPLVEKSEGMVSQHEHSVIVKDKPIVTTLHNKF